jgi:hypothetical protein
VDNYARHQHADVRAWLARPESRPITLHFVPASYSWLNLVECLFSVITRQAIRRGNSGSVSELIATIGAFIGHWNGHPWPFSWTKDADEILASSQRAKASSSGAYHSGGPGLRFSFSRSASTIISISS